MRAQHCTWKTLNQHQSTVNANVKPAYFVDVLPWSSQLNACYSELPVNGDAEDSGANCEYEQA
jgi:hypothetical protein